MLFRVLHSNREMFYFLAIAAALLLGVYWYSQLFLIEQEVIIEETQTVLPRP